MLMRGLSPLELIGAPACRTTIETHRWGLSLVYSANTLPGIPPHHKSRQPVSGRSSVNIQWGLSLLARAFHHPNMDVCAEPVCEWGLSLLVDAYLCSGPQLTAIRACPYLC